MKPFVLAALLACVVSFSVLLAADEPAIRPDPRPTDLTTGRRGSNDEPAIREEPRARDFSAPKTTVGRSTLEVTSFTPEQSEKVRAIREKAAAEIQVIRDREQAEIIALLNDEQRAQYPKYENEHGTDRARGATTTTAVPASAPITPP